MSTTRRELLALALNPAYDSGDHPNDDGMAVPAAAVPLRLSR